MSVMIHRAVGEFRGSVWLVSVVVEDRTTGQTQG
jgi:hypothetical protein